MGKASAARKRLYIIVSAILFSLTTPVPASAQGAENNQEESWNIAVFGFHSPTETKKEESLEFAAVVEIDRESLELKTEYIPVRDGAYDVQNKESGYPDLGIRYDDYVAFNWKDLVDAINILGGVETVISDEEYVYINAYVTQTVAETGIASTRISKAGLRYIDGVQAVAYSRMKLSENDAEQVKRQGKILSLTWKRLTHTDIRSLYRFVRNILPGIKTSLDGDELTYLYKNGREWGLD